MVIGIRIGSFVRVCLCCPTTMFRPSWTSLRCTRRKQHYTLFHFQYTINIFGCGKGAVWHSTKTFDWCFVYILYTRRAQFLFRSMRESLLGALCRLRLPLLFRFNFECRTAFGCCCYAKHIAHVLMWTKQIHYSLRLRWNLMVEMKISPRQIQIH